MPLSFEYRPSHLIHLINRHLKWLPWVSFVLLGSGLFLSFWGSPADYQQGETVRIMYVHVPCSWGAMATYFLMAILSAYGVIKQLPLCAILTKSMAPIGFCLCIISLITGSIWGKPTWGTWWVWDARLTSMLILALLYGAYLLLTFQGTSQAEKVGGIIILIGSINLPIIKWSVNWWHTLHQPASIMRLAKPAIHWQMLLPLGVMAVALASIAIILFLLRLRTELNYRRLLNHQLKRTSSYAVS